jgi:dipeptidyl aminopeptidase/acylaminoacyl peptidase
VAFSRDGSRLASASDDKTVKVWDARAGQHLLSLEGHTGEVRAVTFSPDGSRIASASDDKTVKVWDARACQDPLTLEGHTNTVSSVAFSPDGSRLASASGDKTLKVWDAKTGQDLRTLKGHTESVESVAFSPDGSRIASASGDKTVKVWDAKTGQDLRTLKGHTGGVSSVAYSPDGSRIASGSGDKTLKVWDASTGQQLHTLGGWVMGVDAVAFSPDGSRVFGRNVFAETLAWDVKTGKSLPATKMRPALSRRLAVHGNHRAFAEENLVRIERLRSPQEWQQWHLDEGRVEAVLRARRDREFHEAEAERTRVIDPFACAFHLDRLLALWPDERPALLKRRAATLAAALKRDPDDHHSARSLARQAIADPGTVPNANALLPLIARHQHVALDRLHGALLLRTGNARDASVVLRAAVRNRTDAGGPPTDELLLALALVKLDRRDEARRRLKAASEWMDGGAAPQRVASLLAARAGGPLAALTAVAHVPDVRLNPLDPFTAHELHALRREAETALGLRD